MTITFTIEAPCEPLNTLAKVIVQGEPASKSRARFTKRGSKTVAYTPEKTKQAEERMAWSYRACGGKPHDGDTSRAYGVAAGFFYAHNQRRDVDNMLKLVLDGLNGIAWPDDCQVIEVTARKECVAKSDARTEVIVYDAGRIGRPERDCEHCGQPFKVYPSLKNKQRFCNSDCMNAYRVARRTRICLHCKGTFQNQQADPRYGKYCSRECAALARSVELVCIRCGTAYVIARSLANHGRHFCGPECRQAYWRDRRTEAAKGTCARCGGATSKKTYTHCRGCSHIARAEAGDGVTA